MAKMPFRGIAQIATAQQTPPATASVVVAPTPGRGQAPAQAQPNIRPLGYSAEDAEAAAPRAGLARWWTVFKRMFLDPPR